MGGCIVCKETTDGWSKPCNMGTDSMKPKPQSRDNFELFQAHFDQILNLDHELLQLARKIDWSRFDVAFADSYCEDMGVNTKAEYEAIVDDVIKKFLIHLKVRAVESLQSSPSGKREIDMTVEPPRVYLTDRHPNNRKACEAMAAVAAVAYKNQLSDDDIMGLLEVAFKEGEEIVKAADVRGGQPNPTPDAIVAAADMARSVLKGVLDAVPVEDLRPKEARKGYGPGIEEIRRFPRRRARDHHPVLPRWRRHQYALKRARLACVVHHQHPPRHDGLKLVQPQVEV